MGWAFLNTLTEILNRYDPPQSSAGPFIHTDNLASIQREQMRVMAEAVEQEMNRHNLVLNAATTGQAAVENARHFQTMTELNNEANKLISTLNGNYWKIKGTRARRGGKKLKYRRRKTKKMGNRKHKKTMRRKGKRRNRRTKKR